MDEIENIKIYNCLTSITLSTIEMPVPKMTIYHMLIQALSGGETLTVSFTFTNKFFKLNDPQKDTHLKILLRCGDSKRGHPMLLLSETLTTPFANAKPMLNKRTIV